MQEPILQFFAYEHLPPHLQEISRPFCELARSIAGEPPHDPAAARFVDSEGAPACWPGFPLPRNAERSVALRKLLEAKDAAVRAAIAKS